MPNRDKVIKGLETCAGTNNDGDDCTADCLLECPYKGSLCIDRLMYDALALLKEQPEIVRCKNCVHRGKVEKCVLAAISAEKGCPLFMLDNRGEWYCADGEREAMME